MKLNTGSYPIVLIGLLFMTATCLAQKTTVRGRIIDSQTGEPLPYVNIAFQNSKTGIISDLNGEYFLSTYYATDTLVVSYVGYGMKKHPVRKDVSQVINFELEPTDLELPEVVVKYDGNPADEIVRRVIRNKSANNREKFTAYEYEVYNKVEFDLNNISERFKKRRILKDFQFIFDYVDSTDKKPYLPMFMTESISEYAYRKSPRSRKEVIHASKVSGLPENNISQFLGDMYQYSNIYENQIDFFDKSFVSPIANYGLRHYRYYLTDSAFVGNKWCYRLEFIPKHVQELAFQGVMWIHDTTYAVKSIDMTIPERINLNYVKELKMIQEFDQVDGDNWMMVKDYLMADFNIAESTMGMYGRKTTTYKNFVINQPRDDEFFSGVENVIVKPEASQQSDQFWQENRHIALTQNELELYEMVDSIQKVPAFQTIVDFITLMFTGYKEFGNIELGAYYKIYSYNPVEGHRFRLGIRTSENWSEKIQLYGHVAYGTLDQRFKYGAGVDAMVSEYPRQIAGAFYKNDLEQLGQSQNAFTEDNILSSFLRRTPRDKLTNIEEYKLYFEHEWFRGFSMRLTGRLREMTPWGSLSYITYDELGSEVYEDHIKDAEVNFRVRFAYRERFIFSGLRRYSLGSDYPVVELFYTRGFPGLENSEFNYHIVKLGIRDQIRIGVFGFTDWRIEGGKYFGGLPYPLLELHPGNESWFYDSQAFNLMNFFEFASDEYASIFATHHFDGYFFNRVPIFRRLKWREVITFRTAVGSLDAARHEKVLKLPDNMYSLESKPYFEASVGIENIFKIIRVDVLKRITHLNHPNIATFGVRAMLEIRF